MITITPGTAISSVIKIYHVMANAVSKVPVSISVWTCRYDQSCLMQNLNGTVVDKLLHIHVINWRSYDLIWNSKLSAYTCNPCVSNRLAQILQYITNRPWPNYTSNKYSNVSHDIVLDICTPFNFTLNNIIRRGCWLERLTFDRNVGFKKEIRSHHNAPPTLRPRHSTCKPNLMQIQTHSEYKTHHGIKHGLFSLSAISRCSRPTARSLISNRQKSMVNKAIEFVANRTRTGQRRRNENTSGYHSWVQRISLRGRQSAAQWWCRRAPCHKASWTRLQPRAGWMLALTTSALVSLLKTQVWRPDAPTSIQPHVEREASQNVDAFPSKLSPSFVCNAVRPWGKVPKDPDSACNIPPARFQHDSKPRRAADGGRAADAGQRRPRRRWVQQALQRG